MFTEQIRLLSKNEISDTAGLDLFIGEKQELMSALSEQRDHLRKVNRRVIPEELKQQNREKISEITKRMKDLRHDTKLAEDIKKRSTVMEERLEVIERENEKRRER